jgi:epoxyqueuosine reductase
MSSLSIPEVMEALPSQAHALGFDAVGVAHLTLDDDLAHLQGYLQAGRHGEMDYLARNVGLRADPAALHPGTVSVLSLRMAYLPESVTAARAALADSRQGYISRYALGRDYHKRMRRQLMRLADWLAGAVAPHGHRVFCDSAPVLEKALARNAGLGWIGKNTLLLHRDAGSFFFLGEIYTDLRLPAGPMTAPVNECGRCRACLTVCPTQAFVGPYQLDARRCISYLTIEQRGPIPVPLRQAVGNRIFGCDDCQLVCPWNRYARVVDDPDFQPRHGLDHVSLLALWAWDEATWRRRTEGMPLRRAGWSGWRRNLAVALGNSPPDPDVVAALSAAAPVAGALVAEHIAWALDLQAQKAQAAPDGADANA